MQISTIALGLTQPIGGAATGGGGVLAFGPSLLLDFVGGTGGVFDPSSDASLNLDFVTGAYQVTTTSDQTYGPGQYFVQV